MNDPTTNNPKKPLWPALVLLAGVVAFALGMTAYLGPAQRAPDIPGLLWPNPKVVGPFQLTDHRGAPFDLARLEGRWTLLFFGYTHCPDVCPSTLAVLKQTYARIQAAAPQATPPQVAFVSVDPARDTTERLASFVTHFDADFLGVTGPDPALGALARQFGIVYVRAEPDARGNYAVDHTAAILLTDPQGRLVGLFSLPHDPAAIADQYGAIRRFLEG